MKDSMLEKLGIGRKSLRVQLAEKNKEIQDLKKHLANARKDNSVLTVENRNLRIESAEMRAAYYRVKDILQKRDDAKAAQTAQTQPNIQTAQMTQAIQTPQVNQPDQIVQDVQAAQPPQAVQTSQDTGNTASAPEAANTVGAPESFLDENTEAAQAAVTGIVAAVEASVSIIS